MIDLGLTKLAVIGAVALVVIGPEKLPKVARMAGTLYGRTGCFLNLSYNKDWVVAKSWLTGVAESQNLGANELNFSLLGLEK